MRAPAVALAVILGAGVTAPAPGAGAAEPGRRVPDVIVGFTFLGGAASLNAPGQPLRVRTGDTVVWTNLDPMSHDVSFDALPYSAYLRSPGDSAELTFTSPGYFTYHCNQHPELPGMRGLCSSATPPRRPPPRR